MYLLLVHFFYINSTPYSETYFENIMTEYNKFYNHKTQPDPQKIHRKLRNSDLYNKLIDTDRIMDFILTRLIEKNVLYHDYVILKKSFFKLYFSDKKLKPEYIVTHIEKLKAIIKKLNHNKRKYFTCAYKPKVKQDIHILKAKNVLGIQITINLHAICNEILLIIDRETRIDVYKKTSLILYYKEFDFIYDKIMENIRNLIAYKYSNEHFNLITESYVLSLILFKNTVFTRILYSIYLIQFTNRSNR